MQRHDWISPMYVPLTNCTKYNRKIYANAYNKYNYLTPTSIPANMWPSQVSYELHGHILSDNV